MLESRATVFLIVLIERAGRFGFGFRRLREHRCCIDFSAMYFLTAARVIAGRGWWPKQGNKCCRSITSYMRRVEGLNAMATSGRQCVSTNSASVMAFRDGLKPNRAALVSVRRLARART